MIHGLVWLLVVLFAIAPLEHVPALRAVLALAATVWIVGIFLRERRAPPLPAWPMAAWIVLGAASSLWSPDPGATLHSVFYDMLLPAGIFLAAWRAALEPGGFERLRWGAGAGILLLGGMVAFALATQRLPALLPEAGATGLLHYWPGVGVASTFAALVAPFALLAICLPRREKFAGAVLLAAVVAIGLASENRIVWPSLLLACAAFIAWLWPALAAQTRRAAAVLLIAAVAAGWTAFEYVSSVRRPDTLPIAGLSADPRAQGWLEWIHIAWKEPILGHGFGRPVVRLAGAEGLSASMKQREPHFMSHGHNVLLDVAVQLGVLGLALYLLLLAVLLREYWRLGGRGATGELRLAGAAGLSLLIAMLAKNATDDFMGQAVAIAFWGYAGSLLGALEASRFSRSKAS